MYSNKLLIKCISAVLAVLLIISAVAVSVFAVLVFSDEFLPEYSELIGTVGRPVTVNGDGSVVVSDDSGQNHVVSFGMNGVAPISYVSEKYPVVSQTFHSTDITYTLIHFAGEIPVSRYGDLVQAVFSKLKIENSGDENIPCPSTPEGSVCISEDLPGEIAAGATVYFEYCTTTVPLTEKINGTFDSKLAEMTSYWDEKIKSVCPMTVSVPDGESYMQYYRSLVFSLIGVEDADSDVCFKYAMELLSGKEYTENPKVTEAAEAAKRSITALSGDNCLVLTDGLPSLYDNARVLVTLKSYAYICKKAGNTAMEKEYSGLYEKLLHSVGKSMQNTVAGLPVDWEAATVKGSTDNMILGLVPMTSSASLRRWYVCTMPFGETENKYLCDLAAKSFAYADKIGASDSFVTSLIFSDENTVTLGAGCPAACLAEGKEISVENFALPDGTLFSYKTESDGGEITVSVTSGKALPVSLCFPVFAGNIEYASCPYDTLTGRVSVPAGCDTVTVKLMNPVEDITEKFALETALFEAWSADTEKCTALSAEHLSAEYKKALSLNDATNEEIAETTKSLRKALSELSKTVAGYEIHTYMGEPSVKLNTAKICQRFTTAEAGTLADVTVGGEYRDGVRLKVYTLRDDGYASFSPVGETEGVMCDKGFLFTLNVPVEAQTTYVLSLMSDEETEYSVCKNAVDYEGMYGFEGMDIKVYTGASLDADVRITGADRAELDAYYANYTQTDVSGYTKESVRALNKAEDAASEILCTPYVTESRCKEVLENMKKAFESLETYASDEKEVDSPVAAIIMTAGAVIILGATAVTVIVANRRKNKKEENKI